MLIRDVPLDERIDAAARVCRHEPDEKTRERVIELALNPGDLEAWVRL